MKPNTNEFAIKTIHDNKSYVIKFKDEFKPNKNISSDIASATYKRLKIETEENEKLANYNILIVQINLTPYIIN